MIKVMNYNQETHYYPGDCVYASNEVGVPHVMMMNIRSNGTSMFMRINLIVISSFRRIRYLQFMMSASAILQKSYYYANESIKQVINDNIGSKLHVMNRIKSKKLLESYLKIIEFAKRYKDEE